MKLSAVSKGWLALPLAVLVAAAGCASSGENPEESEAVDSASGDEGDHGGVNDDDAPLSDLLPEEIKEKGHIVWAVEPYYPPFTLSSDDNGLVGINIDLAEEMSSLFGVEYEIAPGSFDGLIPGVNSARYDVAIATMADTEERRQEVDFIDYFQSGSAVFVAEGSDHDIAGIEDLCGYSVGVVKGTFEVEDAEEQAEVCASDGSDELEIQVFNEQAGMLLALSSGRTDAMLMDYVAGSYAATTEGGKEFSSVGDIADPKRKGMIFAKENTELRDAVQEAMQELMDNGRYMEILEEWDQTGGAVDTATLNDEAD